MSEDVNRRPVGGKKRFERWMAGRETGAHLRLSSLSLSLFLLISSLLLMLICSQLPLTALIRKLIPKREELHESARG